jgi:lantibiotic modifying enzyme
VDQCATATLDMRVPERSAGFWNNISQCCGNSGVTEFFTSLYGVRRDARHLAFAQQVARDTLARATADGDGLKWVQAENRVSPDDVIAQTGLMQGASGVGLAMLHLDGALEKRAPLMMLPDNPFA